MLDVGLGILHTQKPCSNLATGRRGLQHKVAAVSADAPDNSDQAEQVTHYAGYFQPTAEPVERCRGIPPCATFL